MPCGVVSAEGVRWKATSAIAGQTQGPIREGIAGSRGAGWIFGILTIERPGAHVAFAVRPQPLIVAHFAARLDYVLALDPRQIVGEFERIAILRLRALVKRRAVEAGVAGPAEVRERAHVRGPPQCFRSLDSSFFIEVSSLQIGIEIDQSVERVEPEFVQHCGTQITCDTGGVILAARFRICQTESWRASRLAQAVVVQAVAKEYFMTVADVNVEARRELVLI